MGGDISDVTFERIPIKDVCEAVCVAVLGVRVLQSDRVLCIIPDKSTWDFEGKSIYGDEIMSKTHAVQ